VYWFVDETPNHENPPDKMVIFGISNMSNEQDMLEKIKMLVAEERSEPISNIGLDTTLQDDLGMDGDDAVEFFTLFSERFNVDLTDLQWERHFGSEYWSTLYILVPKIWKKIKGIMPITVKDLVAAATSKKWQYEYDC
jgi:acyl carrier protein